MMYPAALATREAVPAKATARTTQDAVTRDTDMRITAVRNPVRSEIATPMMTTTIVVMRPKAAKLSAAVENAIANPSQLGRLRIVTVSPSVGKATLTSSEAMMALATPRMPARMPARIQNSRNGCGRALPTRASEKCAGEEAFVPRATNY
jgi:hypothetical protein